MYVTYNYLSSPSETFLKRLIRKGLNLQMFSKNSMQRETPIFQASYRGKYLGQMCKWLLSSYIMKNQSLYIVRWLTYNSEVKFPINKLDENDAWMEKIHFHLSLCWFICVNSEMCFPYSTLLWKWLLKQEAFTAVLSWCTRTYSPWMQWDYWCEWY